MFSSLYLATQPHPKTRLYLVAKAKTKTDILEPTMIPTMPVPTEHLSALPICSVCISMIQSKSIIKTREKKLNNHILEYCKSYIEASENLDFAIFIKGCWGVGKTFFIKKLISSYPKEKSKGISQEDFLYVSLYGTTSKEDIEQTIFSIAHPIFSSRGMHYANSILKAICLGFGAGRASISANTDSVVDDITKNLFSRINHKVLVFDDIERSKMSPIEILGYISSYIVESDQKVIILGNEEKIDKEHLEEFKRIKEKTIGVEFTLQPNFNEAMTAFSNEFKFDKEQDFIFDKIREVATNLKCHNLRIIRQCLFNLQLLANPLSNVLAEEDYRSFIENFSVIFLQRNQGVIGLQDDISTVLGFYSRTREPFDEYDPKSNPIIPYDIISLKFPLRRELKKIIFDGLYDIGSIKDAYIHEKRKKDGPLFKLFDNWLKLTSNEFEKLYLRCREEFKTGKYKKPGEILLFTSLMLQLSEENLIEKRQEEIIDETENYIKENESCITYDNSGLGDKYRGRHYIENEEFKRLASLLKEIVERKENDYILNHFIDEIKNPELHEVLFSDLEDNLSDFYSIPILKLVDTNGLFDLLKEKNENFQERFVCALSRRYGYSDKTTPSEILLEELTPLKELSALYLKEYENHTFDPQRYRCYRIGIHLRTIAEYLETYNQIDTHPTGDPT